MIADGIVVDTAMLEGIFCPVGQGIVDFGAFKGALDDAGYEGWATVEQDQRAERPRQVGEGVPWRREEPGIPARSRTRLTGNAPLAQSCAGAVQPDGPDRSTSSWETSCA